MIVPTAAVARGTADVVVWAMNHAAPPRGGAAQGPVVVAGFFPYRGRHPGACSRSLAAYASGSSSHNRGLTCLEPTSSVPERPGGRRQGRPGSRVPGNGSGGEGSSDGLVRPPLLLMVHVTAVVRTGVVRSAKSASGPLGKSLRPLASAGQNPDFPYGSGLWVGRKIPGALNRILEGRILRNSRRSAPEPALSVGFPGNYRSGPPACSGPVGAHRKGHHRRFGRGCSSGAMGRAFGMVLNCSISSW